MPYFSKSWSLSTQLRVFGFFRHFHLKPLSASDRRPQLVVVFVQYLMGTVLSPKFLTTLISLKAPAVGSFSDMLRPSQMYHCSSGQRLATGSTPSMVPSWPGNFRIWVVAVATAMRLGLMGVVMRFENTPPPGKGCAMFASDTPSPPV